MNEVAAAYVFGSALTAEKPNDVDLCIVTRVVPGSDAWTRIRHRRDALVCSFQITFGIRLSVMLVTDCEWAEVDGVIVRERYTLV